MSQVTNFETVFGFTSNDLMSNRAGQLSETQVSTLKKAARSSSLVSVVIVGIFFVVCAGMALAIGSAFLPTLKMSDPGAVGGLVGIGVPTLFAIILGIVMLFSMRGVLSPKTPTLGRINGMIVQGNRTGSSQKYEIEINGKSFEVSEAAYRLIDPAQPYTVYTAVYGTNDDGTIVAIEKSAASDSKSPLEYEKDQLQSVFTFNEADLAANRTGRLSPAQSTRLSANIGNGVGCGIFLGIIFGIFPLVFIGAFTQNLLLTAGTTAAVFFLFLFGSMRNARGQQRKLADATVALVKGTATARISKVHHSGKNSYTETIYHVEVGGIEFRVEEKVYYAFKEGKPYAIYYVPTLDGSPIVAAEQTG